MRWILFALSLFPLSYHGTATAAALQATSVSATKAGGSAAKAKDGDVSSGWKPGRGSASITFSFGADYYVTGVGINAAGGGKVTLVTSDGLRHDLTLKAGQTDLTLPSVLTESLTIEAKKANGNFAVNEVTFTQEPPAPTPRPKTSATASTTLEGKKKYGPAMAIDGKLSTAWNEGAKKAKGQWLEVAFDKPTFVHHVGLIVGYSKYNQKIGEVWFKNHRIKSARIDYRNGWYYDAQFEDRIDYQYVPARMVISKTRIIIQEVFDTLRYQDTPISEIKFIYEYVDDVKLQAAFDQDSILNADRKSHYLVLRIKGAYSVGSDRAPVNVVLVIDQSGSMSSQDRMKHAREAAKLIVSSMSPRDYLTLISFDDAIYERLPPTLMKTKAKNKVVGIIDTLRDQGGTDIHGSLSRAVQLVKTKMSPKLTNRILLLSDGEPTSGNTNPSDIVAVARTAFDTDSVITSTFGLGADYNEDLMADIAKGANGSYYHITNPAQMFKTFVAEMSTIMKVVGRDAAVEVDIPEHIKIVKVHGYDVTPQGNKLKIPLQPISAAGEQKIVIEFTHDGKLPIESSFYAALTYKDALADSAVKKLEASRILTTTDDAAIARGSRNAVAYAEVLSTVGAQQLEDAIKIYESGSSSSATKMLERHVAKLESENRYLKSAALDEEIAVLKAILGRMKGANSSSSDGKLAIKEAKATALKAKRRSYADDSLDGVGDDPSAELKRLLATNFADPGPQYGAAKPEAIIGILISRGLGKRQAASGANTMGYRRYTAKDYDNALTWFDAALGHDPKHALATYNAACTWGLKKNAAKAVELLERLKGINNKTAKKRLQKAKRDTDLDPVRNDPAFQSFISGI